MDRQMEQNTENDIMDSGIVPWDMEKPAHTALREIYALCSEEIRAHRLTPEYSRVLLRIQLRASEGMKNDG